MSFQAVTWAMKQDISPAGRKFTLVMLASYADADGTCFPGQNRLGKDTSQSDRTVRSHLASLEAEGFIKRERRQRQDGSRTSDRCLICFEEIQPEEISPTPETISAGDEANRKIKTGQPEIISGLTTFEPVSEPVSVVVVSAGARDAHQIHDEICEEIGVSRETHMAFASSMEVQKWLTAGCEREDILDGVRRCMASRTDPPNSMRYFSQAVMDSKATRLKPLPEGNARASPKKSATDKMFAGFNAYLVKDEDDERNRNG